MSSWRRFTERRNREARLDKELRLHLEQEIDFNIASGMTEEEARKAAFASFGNITAVKEDVRQAWGWRWTEQLTQDLRYALRVLRQSPAFTIISVLLLGVGIGTTSIVFTTVNAVFWNPVPVHDPSGLRMVSWTSPTLKYAGTLTYGTYENLRDRLPLLDFACSWRARSSMAEWGPVAFQLVTGNYFRLLGVRPVAGRLIEPEDDRPDSAPVAVIGYRLWQRAYGGTPDVLHEELKIAGRSFRIIGVMKDGFAGLWPLEPQEVMLPFNAGQALASVIPARDRRLWFCTETIGRLAGGITEEQLRVEGQALLQEQFLISPNRDSKDARLLVTDLREFRGMQNLQEKSSQPLRLLVAAAGMILLITCTNIGGLLLARGRARQHELATRLALGAARPRVVRQLVTESILLSAAGGILGVALAYLGAPLLPDALGEIAGRTWLTPAMTPGVNLKPDPRVLSLSILLAVATGILFGLLPALRTTRIELISVLKRRTDVSKGELDIRTGRLLVCIQVALSMVLLIGAGMLGRTLMNLQSVPIGYDPNSVLFVETDPSRSSPTFVQEMLRTLETTPGVTAAAVSQWPLYNNALPRLPVCVPQNTTHESGMDIEPVSPRFFETWGVRFLSGRDFEAQDAGKGAIVNEKLVKTFFANRNPLGEQIGLGRCPGNPRTIVGVVADHMDRQRAEVAPMVYVPYPSQRIAPTTFSVRTSGDPRLLIPVIRRLMQEKAATVDGDVMTGPAYVERVWRQERLLAVLLVFFGTLALIISCLGIFGLLSYMVSGRGAEIGVRMALGAEPGTVLRMVMRESIVPVAGGVVLGTLVSFAAIRWIESILFGVSNSDPVTLIAAAALLLSTAIIASLLPARRAARIDPMRALRCE